MPEEVNMENAEDIIKTQNPEITINAGEVKTKIHIHREKKQKNLVIELGPETRQNILNTNLKIGWHICNKTDYIVANRCFKCSRFNHRSGDCKDTCPLCLDGHNQSAQRNQATINALIASTTTITTVTHW